MPVRQSFGIIGLGSVTNEDGVDVEKHWHRQRNYLYDLFYRGHGYERKRPIKKDGRRRSHRRPKVELEFTKTWKDYQKNSQNLLMNKIGFKCNYRCYNHLSFAFGTNCNDSTGTGSNLF